MSTDDCADCGQPMLPPGETKRPNEYDHASGCPRGLVIERVFEPSAIRRGRPATSPTFVVETVDARWSFMRRRDAQRFIDLGGVCREHRSFCPCGGRRTEKSPPTGSGDPR